MKSPLKRTLVKILIIAMTVFTWPHAVIAAPVGTSAVLQQESAEAQVSRVRETLARDDVQRAMIALGVNPDAARERVASLTQAEVAALESELEGLPAGGDFLAVVGIVFIVLIILELVGVTHIFSKF
ncbi:MAG: PA2779 family protein [Betaproteobacteria bacterium]|nr:PA2779 family protein [Gammaproteobacteria bacterium]MDH3438469.1 PA2779 family protein [Betaproteobacteria bacterium]